jgi:PAS domain S-box-containing protein
MSISKSFESSLKSKQNKSISAQNGTPSAASEIHKQKINICSDEAEYLFNNTGDAIRVINSDFTIRRINRAFAEMTGVVQTEVTGKKCWDVFPGRLCHTAECRLQRILDGEQAIQVEIERMKKDGNIIRCMVTASPLIDDKGKLSGIIEQFRDITEHRQMKEQVKETEDRYRALIELGTEAGEAIVMLQDTNGKEGIQTFFNDQWPKTIGYTKKELLGKSFFDLVHPDDLQPSLERHRQKMAGKTISGIYEMKLIRKDGIEIFAELTGAYTFYQGERANVMFIRDVTERKQTEIKLALSEKQFQTLFENAPVSLWEMDNSDLKKYVELLRAKGVTDLKEYFLNHSKEALYAMSKEYLLKMNNYAVEMMEGNVEQRARIINEISDVEKINPSELSIEVFVDFIDRLSRGHTKLSRELPITTYKGNIKYILQQISIVPGYENTWGKVITADIDITDRKKINDELLKYKNNLEQMVNTRTLQLRKANQALKQAVSQHRASEKMLAKALREENTLRAELELQAQKQIEFTRALVHELKTPLTPLLAASEFLVANSENVNKEFASAISRGAIRLEHRINELLDLSRGEVGLLEVKCQRINPLTVLKNIIVDVQPRVASKGQTLEFLSPKRLPIIRADKGRFEQILLNLIDNAIKYNRHGGKILLRVNRKGDSLFISVSDEGKGIDRQTMASLFEPYQRSKINGDTTGLGLGLSLSKMLIELHGGSIHVTSKQGEGTKISFSMPLNYTDRNRSENQA